MGPIWCNTKVTRLSQKANLPLLVRISTDSEDLLAFVVSLPPCLVGKDTKNCPKDAYIHLKEESWLLRCNNFSLILPEEDSLLSNIAQEGLINRCRALTPEIKCNFGEKKKEFSKMVWFLVDLSWPFCWSYLNKTRLGNLFPPVCCCCNVHRLVFEA